MADMKAVTDDSFETEVLKSDKPVLVGFGISTPANVVEAAAVSDGVIVASALMRMVLDGDRVEEVASVVASMRAALDELSG